jgi:hypothetical protein
MEKLELKKLNDLESNEQHRVVLNRFAALEDFNAEMDINRAWKMFDGHIKISIKGNLDYYELDKHKTWFDEGCTKLFIRSKKKAKLHWL